MASFDHKQLESKWQKEWAESGIYNPDLKASKKPYYNLMMFPYPSAEGLHVGNMYAFTGADVYGRFKRMQGHDVFEPIGLDGFGIHSENYAIKVGRHPKEHAKLSEENFYNQLSRIGNGFSWNSRLETYDPEYYKWTQWLFIKMFEAGLAYKASALVNWCPSCKTVLADEQVIDGKCERCGTTVTKKETSSWFFKITDYADKLLTNIDKIDWPERIKNAQRNWIGKSEGVEIEFKVEGGEALRVFTTRPDTIDSVTFLAVSSTDLPSLEESKEKLGKFTGKYAVHPINNKKLPIWEANYVASDYGTGVIMGVPAYDERDMDFATKYGIDTVKEDLSDEKVGKKVVKFHLRDWLISRQRYWGPPIPMINCKECGWQAVPESDLPVVLPDIKDFKPKGDGVSPLHNAPESWKKVSCPKCGGVAERELDVSDTFLDSSWYFLAYPNLKTSEWKGNSSPINTDITKSWLPVDSYIGGAEHAVLHLLYARFVTMVLADKGFVDFEEPFPFLYGHGLIIKDGAKMSKSKGNVVNPDTYIDKFGADALRAYLMFLGPYDQGGDFRDTGMEGMKRFLNRVWKAFEKEVKPSKDDLEKVCFKAHQTIKKVTDEISQFKFNTSIAAIMELTNLILEKGADARILKTLAQLLAPFAPHMTEELWSGVLKQKGSIHTSSWPKYNEDYLKESSLTVIIQVSGKMRGQITLDEAKASDEEAVTKLAKAEPGVAKWLDGVEVKKVIFVPSKLINFVI